jgi:hypothetical protein
MSLSAKDGPEHILVELLQAAYLCSLIARTLDPTVIWYHAKLLQRLDELKAQLSVQ